MVEHKKNAAGVITTSQIDHHIILGGVYADTPAQKKLSKWMGHSSYLGCGHCMLLGKCGPTGHGMCFQGYEHKRAAGESSCVNHSGFSVQEVYHTTLVAMTGLMPICRAILDKVQP